MRVLHLVTRLNLGGVARPLAEFVPHLDCDAIVSAGVCVDEPEIEMPFDVVRLRHLARPLSLWRDALSLEEIVSLIRRVKPDLVHTHMSKAGWLGRVAAKLLGVPCIHTYYGNIFKGHFGKMKTSFFAALERASIPLLAGATYVSESTYIALSSRVGSPRRTAVIHLAVPPLKAVSRQRARRYLNIPQHTFVVGWIGRMVPVKRPSLAVEAFSQLQKGILVMVGDGPLRQVAEQNADRLAHGRVLFCGWRKDVGNIIPAFDVLSVTSASEGFPVVMIESLFCGVPVVAVEAQGVVDVMGAGAGGGIRLCDAGIVSVEGRYVEALRLAYLQLSKLKEGVHRAKARLMRLCAPKAVAEAYMRFYAEVLRC